MGNIEDAPAFQYALEIQARTRRVEEAMARLTKPIYIWRMAKAKARDGGPRGRGAQTTYFRVVEEIDRILKEIYGG